MTGEMYKDDVTREEFPVHFAIADAVGGTVEPFDVYQGPYVLVGSDIRSGDEPYQIAPRGLGVVRLWLCDKDGYFTVFNEANNNESWPIPYDDTKDAILAARFVIT